MPEEENKVAARRIAEEVFNERNVDALDEILDPDVFNHEAIPELQHGIDGFKEAVSCGYSPPSQTSVTISRT